MLYPDSRSGYFDIRKLESQSSVVWKAKMQESIQSFTVFQKAERPYRSEILGLFFPVHYVIKKKKFSGFGLADIIQKEKFNNFQLDSNLYYQNNSNKTRLTT